jgi:hypothetical protein
LVGHAEQCAQTDLEVPLLFWGLDAQPDPEEGRDEIVCCQEIPREFIISGRQSAPILDAAEEVLDFVTTAINAL